MKAKSEKKPKQPKAAVQLKDLKPKKNPKGGLIDNDPEEGGGGVLLP